MITTYYALQAGFQILKKYRFCWGVFAWVFPRISSKQKPCSGRTFVIMGKLRKSYYTINLLRVQENLTMAITRHSIRG